MLLRFFKNWTLPIAMMAGGAAYLLFSRLPLLAPLKPWVEVGVSYLTPSLIFIMLFVTFCKVSLEEFRLRLWHFWLLVIQLSVTFALAALLMVFPLPAIGRVSLQAAMVCFLCPTATAAAVITGKLGGNASTLTVYTILSNLVTAAVVPWLFPLVEPHEGLTFWASFLLILGKVFPLLICPFLAALAVRAFFPRLLRLVVGCKDLAFYLWSLALAIVVAQTIRSVVNSRADLITLLAISGAGLMACCLQFAAGKLIGGHYRDRISGGQALGQKNTVFAIWMAYTYLQPLSSLGPGSYVLWQNIINSWQLWRKRRKG